jgi:hypothetical protein
MGIPPCRRESIEVGDLFWVDGGRAVRAELILNESRRSSEEEVEVAERGRTERSGHYEANWLLCKHVNSSW